METIYITAKNMRAGTVIEMVTAILAIGISTVQPYISPALGAIVHYIYSIDEEGEKFSFNIFIKQIIMGSLVGSALVQALLAYDIGTKWVGSLGFFSGMLSFLILEKMFSDKLLDDIWNKFIMKRDNQQKKYDNKRYRSPRKNEYNDIDDELYKLKNEET